MTAPKKAPPSPRLLRLDADIKAERDPIKAACLKAERAGFLGRQGFFEEARDGLGALQKEFARKPDARVSAWMQIAEGWIAYFNDQIVAARDHLKRGLALATAAGIDDLCALSSAWLAHLAYTRDKFDEMERYLRISFRLARADDHLTQARLSLVCALSFHFTDHFDLAKDWYIKARSHAIAMNDEASISSVTYNANARRATFLLIYSILGSQPDSDSKLASIGVESSFGFEKLLGISIFGEWVYVVQAMVCSASGDFARAISLYGGHMESATSQGLMHQKASFIADMAWCHVNLGDIEQAKAHAVEAASLINLDMCVEDRFLATGRLSQTYEIIGDMPFFEKFNEEKAAAMRELQRDREKVFELLNSIIS